MDRNNDVESTVVMDASAMAATLNSMAMAVVNGNPELESLVLLGSLRRCEPLAKRLSALIEQTTGIAPPVGALSTTLYRDDLHARSSANVASRSGETYFDFSLEGRTVLLVDDVISAGRTIRAAMGEIMDYGRPKRIQLACLIDRGGRELPIQADYLGYIVHTTADEWISVKLQEVDGEDLILLHERCDK